MPSRFIDQFDIILIDQGRTFIFENDRFGAKEKFYTLYQSLGGQQFSDLEIRQNDIEALLTAA